MANPETTSFTPDNLIYSDFPVASKSGTIVSGAGELSRGTVLALNSSTGKYNIVKSGETTNNQNVPSSVLLNDVDATSSDVDAVIAESGKFAEDYLTFDGSDDIDTFRTLMRNVSLFTDKSSSRE